MTMPSTSMKQKLRYAASWIASEPPEIQTKFLAGLEPDALLALPYMFEFWALPHQLPPDLDWTSWVVLGGRGAGKTRAGAEWVRSQVEGAKPNSAGRARRVALIGETYDQVRDVMIEGPSGIMACSPPDRRPVWEATRRRLVWPNGATAQAYSAHDPEALRGPQFDAAWADEIGCAAIDKGANEPNRFFDPKSSESALPKYSSGARDDFMQMQYLQAQFDYWRDPARNPVSDVYGGSMVDMDYAFVWAWDARPYPFFPNNLDLWSDGGNYARGHWLNGRSSSRSLASVVREICAQSGLGDCDVSELYGVVRGYTVGEGETARAALQPLMMAYGFDAVERDGMLIFRTRDARVTGTIDPQTVAVTSETESDLERVRQPQAETVGRVRLNTIEADVDYQVRAAEAIFPDDATPTVSQSDLPLVLTQREARGIAERWLIEARIARDAVRFSLPPSRVDIGAGDTVELDEPGGIARYRVDHVETGDARLIEAVRIEAPVPAPAEEGNTGASVPAFVSPVPVLAQFLDLPLLTGAEVPHAPLVAGFADPWPGSISVYSSASDNGFVLNRVLQAAAVIGETATPLAAADPGRWDRGAAVRVVLYGGALASADEAAVLNGANVAAIGDGVSDDWEVFQFAGAELVAPQTYDLTLRLRGQAGTDALMPSVWPAGSRFVLIDAALEQIALSASERGLSRNYRVGPSRRPVEDPVYVQEARAFEGVGLRPLAPVHLRAAYGATGDLNIGWVRRTRIDGDSWAGMDVPLGEDREVYLVRVEQGGAVIRETTVFSPEWRYDAGVKLADGVTGAFEIAVAQVSDRFGPGLFRRMELNG